MRLAFDGMGSRRWTSLILAFCTSAGVHGAAYGSLSAAQPEPTHTNDASRMDFELPPLPAAEPEPAKPAPSVPTEPPPPVVVTPRTRPAGRTESSSPTETNHPTGKEPALDLSGVTLSNDSGTGFAMPLGDGSALHGPIGQGAPRGPSAAEALGHTGAPREPALVSLSDLSERPKPPSLTALLRQNYPEEARLRGLRGSAQLNARIDRDGVIRAARLLSESAAGFGLACRRTVLGSQWSAPRDKNGSPVATEIVYTCRFEVDP